VRHVEGACNSGVGFAYSFLKKAMMAKLEAIGKNTL
jgi:hypothetical protein